jgi:hypothetical protein
LRIADPCSFGADECGASLGTNFVVIRIIRGELEQSGGSVSLLGCNWPLGAALSFLMLAAFAACYGVVALGLRMLKLDRVVRRLRLAQRDRQRLLRLDGLDRADPLIGLAITLVILKDHLRQLAGDPSDRTRRRSNPPRLGTSIVSLKRNPLPTTTGG